MIDSLAPFLSFIAIDRRLALANGQSLPDRAVGAALFADVSGFTPLTEALALALGPQRGAEEVTRHLDTVFGSLIGEVEKFGGSVVTFSGDSVTCWFDQDTGLRAAAAALSMQAALEALPAVSLAAGASPRLALKVSVAQGPVRRFVVGDPNVYRLDVLAGRLLDRLGALQAEAQKGEVVLDGHTARALVDELTVATERGGGSAGQHAVVASRLNRPVEPSPWPAVPDGRLSESEIRPWLLPEVYDRLRQGSGAFLADLRPAAALFLAFSGIDYDEDDDAGLLLDAYVRGVQATLAKYDVMLLNLAIGDKGSYLYAVAGAPVAHDDDAARAVAAALELRVPPPQLGYITQIRVGIAQGQMYSGAYGCPDRRTYGVQGDKTNLAARLMEHAQSAEILCDDDVYRQARRRWSFETLLPLRVKGKAGLVRVYRPTGQPAAPVGRGLDQADEPRLVGRIAEVAQLTAAIDALQAGRGGIVTIEGEAGIGKSRLVEELTRLARDRGLSGLIGAGQSIEQQTAYRAWRDLLGSFFDLDGIGDPAERRTRVEQVCHDLIPKMMARLPLLNDILALGVPETPLTAALDAALRRESLTGLVVTLLRMWTRERALILVLEDAHWLDGLSWHLTGQVARALLLDRGPLLLVLVSRGLDELSPGILALKALHGLVNATTITLGALSPDETVALASDRLGLTAGGLPQPVAALIRERSGGNPFFAEELVYSLRERDLIRIEPTGPAGQASQSVQCVVSPELSVVRALLPDTLQGLVLSRIDRLPADQQFTLKIAAVIGRRFSHHLLADTLRRLGAVSDDEITLHLQELVRSDLTTLAASEPEPEYEFKHIVIQEVAYETLLFAQRKQVHHVVAEWYVTRLGTKPTSNAALDLARAGEAGETSTYLPLLVHHFHQAEDWEQERKFARLAGDQAARKHAHDDAVQYLTRALELTPAKDNIERFDLLLARETVYELQGARDQQAQALEQLRSLSEELDGRRQSAVALRQSSFAYQTGDYPAAVLAANQAVKLANSSGQAEAEANGYLQLSKALWQQGNYALAQAHNRRALDIARQAHAVPIQADSLRQQGIIFDTLGEYPAARNVLEAALQLHRDTFDRRGEAQCLNSLGVVAYNQEDLPAANAYYGSSLALKQEMGDRYGQGITLQNLGIVANDQGELLVAERYFLEALAVCREIDDREGEASALDGLGATAQRLGDYTAAQKLIEQALAISRQIGDRLNESAGLANLSAAHLQQGNPESALQCSLEALSIAQEIGSPYYAAGAWQQVGQARLGLGQAEQAIEAFRSALALYQDLGKPRFTIEPLSGLARSASALGDHGEALAHVETILALIAQDAAGAARTPILTYLTCFQVLESGRDPRAPSVLQQAQALLQTQAGRLTDGAARERFLNDVPWNREVRLARSRQA